MSLGESTKKDVVTLYSWLAAFGARGLELDLHWPQKYLVFFPLCVAVSSFK